MNVKVISLLMFALFGTSLVAAEYAFGSITGAVKDAVNNAALSNVEVRVPLWPATVSVSSEVMSRLSGRVETVDDWVTVYASTDSTGSYNFVLPVLLNSASVNYSVEFSASDYNPTTISNVDVRADTETFVEELSYISRAVVGNGNMRGMIRNAQTNAGESGVSCAIRRGSGLNPPGPVIATITSAADGSWNANNLPTGNYVAECSKYGFATKVQSGLLVLGGSTTANQNILITATPRAGETRIVLRWDASPRDLDSHITGPLSAGGRFHVYYSVRGSKTSSPFTDLDWDVTTGHGPETVTITRQFSGVYRYSVHDFTNRYASASSLMAWSRATVDVNVAGKPVRTFHVPPRLPGTLWTVFELDGATIVPINRMSYHQDPFTVT